MYKKFMHHFSEEGCFERYFCNKLKIFIPTSAKKTSAYKSIIQYV